MGKSRLEAFSDGVIAIVITIMVLEMKVPHEAQWEALLPMWPVFLSYMLSFLYVGIFWNSHHHILHAARRASAGVMWANLHLLFWLSLLPFATGWMGENHFAALPTALYGAVLLMVGAAFWVLERSIMAADGPESPLRRAVGGLDRKGLLALALYAAAIPLAFALPAVSQLLYVAVALFYLIPDRRIEQALAGQSAA